MNKWIQAFLLEVFTIFLSIKGRINFLQLERYGKYTEQRYRQQFEKTFDFLSFNKELVTEYGSGHYVIAIDPSFVNKAGKKTPGIGYFWSGCAGAVKRGLEIPGLAAIDIDNHTDFIWKPYRPSLRKPMSAMWFPGNDGDDEADELS